MRASFKWIYRIFKGFVIGCIALYLLGVVLLYLGFSLSCSGKIYESNDLADYGNYIGNTDNDTPTKFINSFFPGNIEPYFSNVQYHYKAKKCDTYGYEVWLEFVIEDPTKFNLYYASILKKYEAQQFYYDELYCEYTIADEIDINPHPMSKEDIEAEIYSIRSDEIGKILVSEATHHFIYSAIGVCDGGATDTEDVGFFFSHFNIDPIDYQARITEAQL